LAIEPLMSDQAVLQELGQRLTRRRESESWEEFTAEAERTRRVISI